MKIIGYLRVSTDQQVESGLGLDAQKSACEEYAKKMGLEITEFFRDEGFSGSLSLEKRPGMLDAINSLKKTDILVVAKRDRLGRDPLVLAMIESAVSRKGAKIISAAGEGTDRDDPASCLMRRMIDAFSEYERLIIGARTKAALKTKKDKGQRVGHIPFGCKLAENSVNLQQNEVECSVINNMKELRAKGLSIRDIAITLNKRSLLNRKGAKWNHASLHRVMKNQNVLNK
jgi:DNA invertase Pin-like site-specific DNA recombinase